MESSEKRTRGPNKHKPWQRDADGDVAVLRIPLEVSDPWQRVLLEKMFWASYSLRRALQRDARDRVSAYRAATHEREREPAALRERLGLSRQGLEYRAYEHVDAAPHLRQFVTKALSMSLADDVWNPIERHLFRDASGRTQGLLRVGRWYDYARIPGRAKSHTKTNVWETFRLHGSLAAHRAAYTDAAGRFVQPRHMRQIECTRSWWRYDGPLAVVFSGLGGGRTLVLPVRLPTAPSNQPILDHFLADPSKWHKIDLVRHRDPSAAGGWRYEAHLMVLSASYVSPRVAARRAGDAIATGGRSAGIDVNVSNITVASHDGGTDVQVTRIERSSTMKARDRSGARRERRRQRALDRSRRAMNREQYQLSKRQQKRARRREERGLPPQQVIPSGPRTARTDGKPVVAYRRDRLSASYRRGRAAQVADANSATQARRDHARRVAGEIVHQHGYRLVVEDCNLAAWSRSWGRALAAFSPGTLLAAIEREALAVARIAKGAGGVARASTKTALSQHCPCGARVEKTLADRVHNCVECRLRGDRDAVAAVLASFTVFTLRDQPSSAFVDYDASRAALVHLRRAFSHSYEGWQDTLTESNAPAARDGDPFVVWRGWTPDNFVVARRTVGVVPCSTPDEISSCWTKSERVRMRANLNHTYASPLTYLWDSS